MASLRESTVELKKKLTLKVREASFTFSSNIFIPFFFQQEESARRHVTQLEEIRRKAMEMSILRNPSAEDHHSSPITDNNRTTTSIPTIEEISVTRKCCTLCNLLVGLLSGFHLVSDRMPFACFSVSFGSSSPNTFTRHTAQSIAHRSIQSEETFFRRDRNEREKSPLRSS